MNTYTFFAPISVTLDELWWVNTDTDCYFDKKTVISRDKKITPLILDRRTQKEYWRIHSERLYLGVSKTSFDVPESMYAVLHPRQIVSDNGIVIPNLLFYESGIVETINFSIKSSGDICITPKTQLGIITLQLKTQK